VGAVGGLQNATLKTFRHIRRGTNGAIRGSFSVSDVVGGNANGLVRGTSAGSIPLAGFIATAPPTFTGTAQGGTSTPVKTLPPGIVGNYIIRVL
jgi:hypothetical protein